MKLSVLHAESVENYFMANGFPKDKVISGGAIPETGLPGLISNNLTECLHPDRKVVIVFNPTSSHGR